MIIIKCFKFFLMYGPVDVSDEMDLLKRELISTYFYIYIKWLWQRLIISLLHKNLQHIETTVNKKGAIFPLSLNCEECTERWTLSTMLLLFSSIGLSINQLNHGFHRMICLQIQSFMPTSIDLSTTIHRVTKAHRHLFLSLVIY